jgi:hypothetical protein
VVANYESSVAIVRCDKYGFTVMNFKHLISLLTESFAFPMHIEQEFFSSDVKQWGNWKVVLRREPKG